MSSGVVPLPRVLPAVAGLLTGLRAAARRELGEDGGPGAVLVRG
jgi:hypothetical protein